MTAMSFYLAAANKAASMSKFAFLITPKLHTYHHLLLDARRECYNMRWFHCFSGEDYMGSLKPLCIACAGSGMSLRVLRRTLLRVVAQRDWT